MSDYAILLRGINVGGRNKIRMAELRSCLTGHGFTDVTTYIQSGNVILRSPLDAAALAAEIQTLLPRSFELDSTLVKVLALNRSAYQQVVDGAPDGFGADPEQYRDNVLFLIDTAADELMAQIEVREGVDQVWPGERAIYFRNSMAMASRSRLSRLVQLPIYSSVTIRNWNTTRRILTLLQELPRTGPADA